MSATDNYLRDTLTLIIERAIESKSERERAAGRADKDTASFEAGRAAAYYEVVSTMLGQLGSFGLAQTDFGVPRDFIPDRDLM